MADPIPPDPPVTITDLLFATVVAMSEEKEAIVGPRNIIITAMNDEDADPPPRQRTSSQ